MGQLASQANYRCHHCGKQYVTESGFLEHKCNKMLREEILQTVDGQAGLQYYQHWMRCQKRIVHGPESFLNSNSFKSIIAFAAFVKKVKLLKPTLYIQYMVYREYPPIMWMNDKVYSEYLEYVDSKVSPIQHARISCETLLRFADHYEMDVSDSFREIPVNKIIEMIRTRKLSPWLLLCSKTFLHMFNNDCNIEQKKILEQLINPESWSKKLAEHKAELTTIRLLVSELGI